MREREGTINNHHRLPRAEEDMEYVDDAESVVSGDEEVFTEDEEDDIDTTAEQYQRGKDIQGIPWDRLQWSREGYRVRRLEQYPNYQNLKEECEKHKEDIEKESLKIQTGARFYDFFRNYRLVQSTIVHFQLRNLLWCTSSSDVYAMHKNCVYHWNTITRRTTKVMDVAGGPGGGHAPGLGRVQISTMCVKKGLVAAGGFSGELLVRRLESAAFACSTRVTLNENGITNGIEVYDSPTGSTRIATANNDAMIRLYDTLTFQVIRCFNFPFAVNYATVNRDGGKILCCVGDDPDTFLMDADSGTHIAKLSGHLDYSFAVAWHPDGNVVATGNQDKTIRLWDVRYLSHSLATIQGRLGAIRALRYSSDGRFLAAAEPADFAHIYDVRSNYLKCQEVDFFGEIAGICFSPDTETFFLSVADITYGSLMEFDRYHSNDTRHDKYHDQQAMF